jgi:hypothetical protein
MFEATSSPHDSLQFSSALTSTISFSFISFMKTSCIYGIWNKRLHSFGRGVLWSTYVCYTALLFVMEACICIGRSFLELRELGASWSEHYTLFIFVPKSIVRKGVLYIFLIP